jgi:hypothetical protein
MGGIRWKIHRYFQVSRQWHPEVTLENAVEALEKTDFRVAQPNGRIRRWGYVEDLTHYVRVILLADEETIFDAFIDRDYPRRSEKRGSCTSRTLMHLVLSCRPIAPKVRIRTIRT